MQSPYRPHIPGYDYYDAGIYHITIVTRNREPLLGSLNMDAMLPAVILNDVGQAVMECWQMIPAHQSAKGRKIGVLAACCMPDHFHGVIEVKERMDVSVGEVICGFKIGCTQAWRLLRGQPCTAAGVGTVQPYTGAGALGKPCGAAGAGTLQPYTAAKCPDSNRNYGNGETYMAPVGKVPHNMSRKQRAAYYASRPRQEQPLFEDNYDDTICMSHGQRDAMINYVNDNPRRAIMRKLFPGFMTRCLHVMINGHEYAAFGNLFLLRWANKEQVFCHRMARLSMLNDEERRTMLNDEERKAMLNDEERKAMLNDGERKAMLNGEERRSMLNGEERRSGPSLAHAHIVDESRYITKVPYVNTAAFGKEHDQWIAHVLEGATVLVTPGISAGERQMKMECLQYGYPLIHLQKEPISRYWKPEKVRFDACCMGSLLILAPWDIDKMGEVNHVPSDSDYARFHNLNSLASEICAFYGEYRVLRDSF